jgi:hypothetical protein
MSVERLRSSTSAYVYGNVLVLAAILESGETSVSDGDGVLIVAVTTLSTYFAHVMAHDIAQWVGRTPDEHRRETRHEFRDAVPILVSGVPPLLLLGAAALDWLPALTAQNLAAAFVIARLAGVGWNVQRLSGEAPPRRALWSGFALAAGGVVIAVLKVALGH